MEQVIQPAQQSQTDLLNEAQSKDALRVIFVKKDKELLWQWIVNVFGVRIPRKAVCRDHQAPFDFVCDVFFGESQNVIAVADRGGGKTLNFAMLDCINSYYHDDCETATVGAIEEQAKKCYGYFQKFIRNIPLLNKQVIDSLQSTTHWRNRSVVQILTGTIRGVNAPHPQKVFLDEAELMLWNVLQEAFSMAQSKGDIAGQTIITSTRKFAFGPMERLLANANKMGFKVYRWCVRETIEPHDPEMCRNSIYNEDCQGRCGMSDGYKRFADVVAAKRRLDSDTWKSQWLCERPMSKGLVYPQFNEAFHVTDVIPDPGRPLDLSEDFGFAEGHADVVGFFQKTASGKKQMVDEIWIEGRTDDEIICLVEDKLQELGFVPTKYDLTGKSNYDRERSGFRQFYNAAVRNWYCPPEEPSKIELRRRCGYRVVSQNDSNIRKVSYGIPLIRKDLEDEMIEFDRKCVMTISEFKMYPTRRRGDGTFLDEPDKKFDNGPDMVRYFYINDCPITAQGSFVESKREVDDSPMTEGVGDMVF